MNSLRYPMMLLFSPHWFPWQTFLLSIRAWPSDQITDGVARAPKNSVPQAEPKQILPCRSGTREDVTDASAPAWAIWIISLVSKGVLTVLVPRRKWYDPIDDPFRIQDGAWLGRSPYTRPPEKDERRASEQGMACVAEKVLQSIVYVQSAVSNVCFEEE